VPLQKLLCRHKKKFTECKSYFLSVAKCLLLPQYVDKKKFWHKNFEPTQNILGPVKGQGIRINMQLSVMPSPSADPKFSLSMLKFLSKLKFSKYIQNVLSILK
jgi:hypothetical protein